MKSVTLLTLVGGVVSTVAQRCHFKDSLFHDLDSLAEWSLNGAVQEGSSITAKETLDPVSSNHSTMAITVLTKRLHTGGPQYTLQASFSEYPSWGKINGTLGGLQDGCNHSFLQFQIPGGEGAIQTLVTGADSPGVIDCLFNESMFHEGKVDPGLWGDVFVLQSLNKSAFTIHNANGTFADAVAKIRVVSGTEAIATAVFVTQDGVHTTRSLHVTGAGDQCNSIRWWDQAGGFGFWDDGPDRPPEPWPCPSVFDEHICRNGYKSTCEWCSSSDNAHHLCFSAVQAAKLARPEWNCS